MSENQNVEEVKEVKTVQEPIQEPLEIEVDAQTAFQMKVQEFDVKIATAEVQVANLKKEKLEFIYNNNIQMITEQHKQNVLKKEIEQEALRRANKK